MPPDIPDHLIFQLSQVLAAETGLFFPENRWRILRRGIAAAVRDLSEEDNILSYIQRLLSSPFPQNLMDALVNRLTVGETYFFRDKSLFHVLENNILPELIGSRLREKQHKLRFWSAGCCTGEEAYSLSILLDQMLPDMQEWDITILATDINSDFLRKAEKGIYRHWSFRETPSRIKEKYFREKEKQLFEIYPNLKKIVTFARSNLTSASCFENVPEMDIILCRNVMMYFSPESIRFLIERLAGSLPERGWLAVSPSETNFVCHDSLEFVRFPDVILHRKI